MRPSAYLVANAMVFARKKFSIVEGHTSIVFQHSYSLSKPVHELARVLGLFDQIFLLSIAMKEAINKVAFICSAPAVFYYHSVAMEIIILEATNIFSTITVDQSAVPVSLAVFESTSEDAHAGVIIYIIPAF